MNKFLKYIFIIFVFSFISLSSVFADTTIDTANFINVTGVKWSETGLFYSFNPTYNNDWLLNDYYVSSGTFVNSEWNYIEFSYFEHSGQVFNPCNSSSKFTANFSLLFTSSYLVDQVVQVKWGNDNCAMTSRNNQTGLIELSCGASPSGTSQTDIFVYYSDSIFQQNQGYVYISRDIDISCGLNTDAIINNDNANTQNIINNNNQNTQDIINNNNQNTQDMIDSQKACSDVHYSYNYNSNGVISNKYLSNNGNEIDSNTNVITPYLKLTAGNTVLLQSQDYMNNSAFCFYKKDKSVISCESWQKRTSISVVAPNDTYYIRSTIGSDITVTIDGTFCTNGNQVLNDSINNLDDSINDDDTSGATSEASEFFSSFDTETFGLTSIITAPLNLIRSLLSSSCSDLQLPLPYLNNKYLILPCMTSIYSEHFGTFFTLYQTITYGIIAYWVCVRIFNQVKDFKNPEHDEIEVMDL